MEDYEEDYSNSDEYDAYGEFEQDLLDDELDRFERRQDEDGYEANSEDDDDY